MRVSPGPCLEEEEEEEEEDDDKKKQKKQQQQDLFTATINDGLNHM